MALFNATTENMTFLCDKVTLDGERLLPLDPAVDFVFLRINVDVQELLFVYKETYEPPAEERELIIKWDHIMSTSISKECRDNLITFIFNRNLCGHTECNLIVSDLIFERLSNVIDLMYFYMMRIRYGLTETQAREQIRELYVFEDDFFGYEEDFPTAPSGGDGENASQAQGLISTISGSSVSQSSSSSEDENLSLNQNSSFSVNVSEFIFQVVTDEMAEGSGNLNENDAVAQLANAEIEDKAEGIEDKAEGIEDKAEGIEGKAEEIKDKAEEIKDKAEEIKDKAEEIEGKAEEIGDKAEEIEGKAEEIEDKAEEIEEQAEKIKDKIDEIEPLKENDSVESAVEEKVQKESPVCPDEKDVEEK